MISGHGNSVIIGHGSSAIDQVARDSADLAVSTANAGALSSASGARTGAQSLRQDRTRWTIEADLETARCARSNEDAAFKGWPVQALDFSEARNLAALVRLDDNGNACLCELMQTEAGGTTATLDTQSSSGVAGAQAVALTSALADSGSLPATFWVRVTTGTGVGNADPTRVFTINLSFT